ncbi:MAG: hypothetical protein LUC47_02465 [Clostridiales bacterium]|nr:hypothetical protein [Clostridiales bacterium]
MVSYRMMFFVEKLYSIERTFLLANRQKGEKWNLLAVLRKTCHILGKNVEQPTSTIPLASPERGGGPPPSAVAEGFPGWNYQ